MAEERYDERQIGAILHRATEIQSEIRPDAQGLTLQELQQVAEEVGIEPHIVERAAHEVRTQSVQPKPLDASSAHMFDTTVDVELTNEAWDDIVMSLRRFTGRPGTTTSQGSTREWIDGSDMGSIALTAASRNGRTRFRMLSDQSGVEGLWWVIGSTVGILGTIIAGVATGKAGLGPLIVTIVATSAFFMTGLTTYFGARLWRRKARKTSEAMFVALVAQAQELTPQPLVPGVTVDEPEVENQEIRS